MSSATAESMIDAAPARERRRIAVVLSRFPTVTETFILREFVEMERQGQPVRLVPMIKESPPFIHDAAKPWTERALYTRFVSAAIVSANIRTALRHPWRYLSMLARLSVGTIRYPRGFVRTLALFPKSIFIAQQLQEEGIGHIHVHWASHPTTLALIAAAFSDITFSFTVHAHDIQVDRSLLGWKLREARFVRSCTEFNKRFLERLYPRDAKGKIIVVHYGIEPDLYAGGARPFSNTKTAPRIITVAAHKPYKGLRFLIEACAMLRDEGIDFQCDLIGHGPLYAELDALVRHLHLEDHVHLLGARPEEEVAKRMRECDVFALPSIVQADGKMEGMPNALIEAMASGRPVISTTTAGIPELIDHGVDGLLVPPEDSRALADALRKMLTDRDASAAMGDRGKEKVVRHFNIHRVVAELLERIDLENATEHSGAIS